MIKVAVNFIKIFEVIFSDVGLNALDLIVSPKLLIVWETLHFVLEQQKFLNMHRTMEENLSNDFGCLGF